MLQRIPHDATKYRNNPVELLDISKRNRIGSEYALTANTKLLITGTGANNSTTILDSTGKTVTRAGDTKISTAQSIIGGSSIYFDGTGDYLSLADSADWDFGSGDFTIDAWVNFIADTNIGIIGAHTDNNNRWVFSYDTSVNILTLINNISGTRNIDVSSSSFTIGSSGFEHLAVVRSGNVFKLYRNGTDITATGGSASGSMTETTNGMTVGALYYSGITSYLNGYLSHIRIIKGQALWTSNFVPPKYISNNYIGA